MPIKESQIVSAADVDEVGTTAVELTNGRTVFVPPAPEDPNQSPNSDRIVLGWWVDHGGTITPYTPPAP